MDDFPNIGTKRASTFLPARRSVKSLGFAQLVAETLRQGGSAFLLTRINGEYRCERIVGVPGFADGRQLTDG